MGSIVPSKVHADRRHQGAPAPVDPDGVTTTLLLRRAAAAILFGAWIALFWAVSYWTKIRHSEAGGTSFVTLSLRWSAFLR